MLNWTGQTPEKDLGDLVFMLVGIVSAAPEGERITEAWLDTAFGLAVHPSNCAEENCLSVSKVSC